jgi:hypothetical protein
MGAKRRLTPAPCARGVKNGLPCLHQGATGIVAGGIGPRAPEDRRGWRPLRRGYRFSRERIIAALAAFAGQPRVGLEDPRVAARTLDWMRGGMDFADALHLAKARGCRAFVSFDQRLAAVANALSEAKVRAL